MKMAADIKMDELLVRWLSSDGLYESIMNMIEVQLLKNTTSSSSTKAKAAEELIIDEENTNGGIPPKSPKFVVVETNKEERMNISNNTTLTPIQIPPLVHIPRSTSSSIADSTTTTTTTHDYWSTLQRHPTIIKLFPSHDPTQQQQQKLSKKEFMDITKDICRFPSFFNSPLYKRIQQLMMTNNNTTTTITTHDDTTMTTSTNNTTTGGITLETFRNFYIQEMEPFDDQERFFRLVKKPHLDYITREDFLPFIEELLISHPGLEFLSNHAEFQEKYAVTVITRIFYSVCCKRGGGYNGKITLRQLKRSNLLEAFHKVAQEEDINKVTQYFSYEHFYVLYCRFWELDQDRDYLITRDDLIKYADCSLSHLIIDRIFEAAPRPFDTSSIVVTTTTHDTTTKSTTQTKTTTSTKREHLTYEDFIFFMLSEEDKANEISVRYWFTCVDVDGDGKLSTMDMRSLYVAQLQRMQCLGHEIVPFEDMLCQMMDMIKPASQEYFVVQDFLQPECSQVSGALFDALFNLNKYLQFEQRDPFMERQKREDEFECDWDRFACIDYNRLAMEEEAREEEAMEIDWVTVDEDGDEDDFNSLGLGGASEAPF